MLKTTNKENDQPELIQISFDLSTFNNCDTESRACQFKSVDLLLGDEMSPFLYVFVINGYQPAKSKSES